MTDKKTDRREREHDRRMSEIKEAAIVLFASKGYEGVTIEDIAQELGYAKASLYYYFSGKEAIVKALIGDAMDEAGRRMDALMLRSSNPVQNLTDLFDYYIDDYTDSHGFFNIYHQVAHFMDSILNESERREMLVRMQEMNERIVGLIRRGISTGDFIDMDPQVLGEMLMGMISGLMHQMSYSQAKGWDRAAMKAPVIRMLLKGIRPEEKV